VRQRQARGDTALTCTLSVALGSVSVPQRLAVAVYRITQEALTNVMRHAQASRVDMSVTVDVDAQLLKLTVADNGIGFLEQPASANLRGLGLAGMRERILANQGRLQFLRAQPHGLVLEAVFPLPPAENTHAA